MARNKELLRRVQEHLIVRISASLEYQMRSALYSSYKAAAEAFEKERMTAPAVRSGDEKIYKSLYKMHITAFSSMAEITKRQIEGNSKSFRFPEKKDAVFNQSMINFARLYAAQKITQISKTTESRVNEIIVEGVENNVSIPVISKNILSVGFTESKLRAHMISRTEVHSAANAGSYETAKESEVVEMKEWIPVEDHRTRNGDNSDFDHMHVQPVLLNEPFNVSGEYLMYPGDPAGSPGNIIMCRCAVGYLVA